MFQEGNKTPHKGFVVALDQRLLKAPNGHLVGLMKREDDPHQEGTMDLSGLKTPVCVGNIQCTTANLGILDKVEITAVSRGGRE